MTTSSNSDTVSSTWKTIRSVYLTPGIYLYVADLRSSESLTKFGGRVVDASNTMRATQFVQQNEPNMGMTISAILEISSNSTIYCQAFGTGSTTSTITANVSVYKLDDN